MKIEYNPIGIVHSPFNDPNDIPKQPSKSHGTNGLVEVYQTFQSGLSDLDGFSVVHLNEIIDNRLMISGPDILDGQIRMAKQMIHEMPNAAFLNHCA